ncbi:50S ribosomal protein L11 methyltransferase [Hyphomicrobium sp.]|uniref:50S ribosomal protein L11 methyltransferase n=1 Tax=Hyphomicrobium sp. TaxID=82 RepID=UPI002B591FB0|nr:50S ribosomal protein L11 methyltransferase [Hyphomicrobium sp.]HRN88279.1 50S ribosomal protein L11 methyltransferase [Hyphomicrobium sp.]HRQ27366.1 50S ribosomal protein L11 methyltransferase [Hyphomicrobium sp.]
MRIEYHRTLIADRVRNQAFHDALARTIRKGETTVADIGAGTGLIGLMAAKLGAREVILYEAAEVAGVADATLRTNRARGCHLMPCHSTEMEDPPRVDLVVSETLGNYAFEENIIATLADAERRHLKDGGVIIPSRVRQFVAPVITDRIHRELTVWDDVGFGLDLSVAREMSLNNVYVRTLTADELLGGGGAAKVWDEVTLGSDTRGARKGEASWTLDQAQTVYGFAYWWEAELIAGVTLSTAPDAPRTHWEQLYFPLTKPMAIDAGESVLISLRSKSSEEEGTHLGWTAVHFDRDGASKGRQAMDLDKGWIP